MFWIVEPSPPRLPPFLPRCSAWSSLLGASAGDARVIGDAGFAVRVCGAFEQWHQFASEQEVRQVIRLHLYVVAVDRGGVGKRHNASVVGQHVDPFGAEFVATCAGCGSHRVKRLQITFDGMEVGVGVCGAEFERTSRSSGQTPG